jgi:TatD DNase family protein
VIFDSHCHLDPRNYGGEQGVRDVIATARAAGVTRMLTVGAGYGDGSAARAVKVASEHEGVWASVGVHPHDAKELDAELLERLTLLAAEPCVVAWGEIGLDYFYDHSPREVQREAFRLQIRRGLELELPLILHDRDSEGEVEAILLEEGAFEGAGVLYHCYAGDVEAMERLVGRGAYVSIPGTVTYRNSLVQREVARRVRSDRYLVETDAPFLTPEPLRGRRNEPCHTALTVEAIAELRSVSPATVARETWDNASRLFRL